MLSLTRSSCIPKALFLFICGMIASKLPVLPELTGGHSLWQLVLHGHNDTSADSIFLSLLDWQPPPPIVQPPPFAPSPHFSPPSYPPWFPATPWSASDVRAPSWRSRALAMASVLRAADRAAETAAGAQKVADVQRTAAAWQFLLLMEASSSVIWPAEPV